MANESPSGVTSTAESSSVTSNLFAIGAELVREVQSHVGTTKVRSLRLTLGGRAIKDFPVSPATAIASVLLVILAVVISNLRVEVVKETDVSGDTATGSPAAAASGGAQ